MYRESRAFMIRAIILVFRPPVITGITTLNEGDTLDLDCDKSNSNSLVGFSVKWFSPEGVVLSNERTLEIMNIQGSAAGTYTCVTIRIVTGATINSTAVNVTVQCKCQVKQSLILHIHITQYGSSWYMYICPWVASKTALGIYPVPSQKPDVNLFIA